ncbi:MAG: Ferrichrome-iron receptor [uncultured Sphingomonas sp.]|uniref:Ferrichrome-iron receptor n=1 Tax=uncultured Sphingomonas sp. TaxID=158754 RepID=A0A6J4SLU1_9SPHN|nr:TonB-dependent siderophore receptor [uncultured Sphingomonas sp.]CAA9502691.1 MAG: Ferrichrome-iron receptor [uncultured Sphingomonas sp.]
MQGSARGTAAAIRPYRIGLLAGAALLAGLASPAEAQTTDQPAQPDAAETPTGENSDTGSPEGTDSQIETVRTEEGEIIVTARRFVPGEAFANKSDIPLIETPQSVSVVTRDQIDLLNFVDAQQAVRYTAGVFGENYGPDLRFDFFTVRGFTPRQYIDGLAAPVSTTIFSTGLDLYAFESLELLKGPASVLYGSAPPGGIYNETSRRPSNVFNSEIQAKFGQDDYKSLAGTITGPVTDAVSLRFTGLGLDREAERDGVSARRLLLAPSATIKIGDATRLTGLFHYQRDRVRGDTNGFLPVFGTLLPNPLGEVDRDTNLGDPENLYRRRQRGMGFDLAHEFTDALTFRSNARWSRYRERTPTGVYGGGGLVDDDFDSVPDDFRTVQQFNFSYAEDVRAFTIDNRLHAKVATGALEHDLLVGLDYRNVDNESAFGFIFGNRIDLFDPENVPLAPALREPGYPFTFSDLRLKQVGFYAQDHIGLGNFFVTLNGRYDRVNLRNDNPGAPATNPTYSKQDEFTYRVGANYVFDNGFAPYIGYATSFEPVLGTNSVTGEAFRPSSGRQIEGGIKYNGRNLGPGVRLFATAALFKIRQKDVVQTLPAITPVFGTQVGEVEVWGGELELVARFREQLSVNGSYSYNKSEVTESSTAAEVGADLPTTPKHKASVFFDYTIPRGTLAGFGFGAGGRYTSRSAGSLPGPFNPVVYYGERATLFDATVHYDLPGWRFAINGSNIFDKTYVARCSGPGGCTYGAGRQVIGTLIKRF